MTTLPNRLAPAVESAASSPRVRLFWLDSLRAFSMLIVILGHSALPDGVNKYIYSFHMMLFFMISGMTHRAGKYERLSAAAADKGKKLVAPHVMMNILMIPLWLVTFKVLDHVDAPIRELPLGILYGNSGKYQSPSNVTYFLLVLFLVEVFFYLVERFTADSSQLLVVTIGVIGVLGLAESRDPANYAGPWHIEAVPVAMIFYLAGYLLMSQMPRIKPWLTWKNLFILSAILLVVGWWCQNENGRVSLNGNSYGSFIYFLVGAFATSTALILLFTRFPRSHVLEYVGRFTIIYVGLHVPLLRLIQKNYPSTVDDPWVAAIVAFGIFFALIPVCYTLNRFAPFLFGRSFSPLAMIIFGLCFVPLSWGVYRVALTYAAHGLLISIGALVVVAASVILLAPFAQFLQTRLTRWRDGRRAGFDHPTAG